MRTFKYYVAVIRDSRKLNSAGVPRYYGVIPVANIAVEMINTLDMDSVREGLTKIFNQFAVEKRPLPESKGIFFIKSDTVRWLKLHGLDPMDSFLDIKEVYVTVEGDL